MEVIAVIMLVVFIGAFIVFQYSRYNRLIHEKIEEMGGNHLNHERRWGFIGIGPYKMVGKGQTVYWFSYEINGHRKEGWVKFGSIFGPDWRL